MNKIYVDYEPLTVSISHSGRTEKFLYKFIGSSPNDTPVKIVKHLSDIFYHYLINGEDFYSWKEDGSRPVFAPGLPLNMRQKFWGVIRTITKIKYLLGPESMEFPFWPEENFAQFVTHA